MTDQNKITKIAQKAKVKVKEGALPLLKNILLLPYTWLSGIYLTLGTPWYLEPKFIFPSLALTSLFLGLGLSKIEFGSKYQDIYARRKKKILAKNYSKTKWNGILLFSSSIFIVWKTIAKILNLEFFMVQNSIFGAMFAFAMIGFSIHTLMKSEYTRSHRFFWGFVPLVLMGLLLKYLTPSLILAL